MLIIDFDATATEAVEHGFMKGLGAPMLVLSNFNAPAVKIPPMVQASQSTVENALANDWANIAADFHVVVKAYGENTEQAE
ncbi:hypothetical protein [Aquitalea pelogenes]|uniref:hypothetical protein n=1 Tax=Aquitalea pelogenes TaxID=1293573 RepID=UPI0035AEF8F7